MGLLNPIFFHQEVSLGTPAVVDPNELNYTTPDLEATVGARVKINKLGAVVNRIFK